MPPEVFNNLNYDFKFDIFSLGVIMYTMLACNFPFNGNNVNELQKEILNNEPNFSIPEFKHISSECKDLISNMLCKDRHKRYNVNECLSHNWFHLNKNNSIDDIQRSLLDSKTKTKAMSCINN